MLNSSNASQKFDIKVRDHHNDYEKPTSQGFSNIQKLKKLEIRQRKLEGTNSLVSFSEHIHLNSGSDNIRHLESLKKSTSLLLYSPILIQE